MITRYLTGVLLLGLVAGCSDDPPPSSPTPTTLWTADDEANGPRLFLDAAREGGVVEVTVWGAELGEVFGWSVHLDFDPGLSVGEAAVDEVLGQAEAAYVAAPRPGDVALGGARRGPELGAVAIDAETRLAWMRVTGSGASRLDIQQAIVRRVDGSYVDVVVSGGELDTRGEP